jgi:hypothetical protein
MIDDVQIFLIYQTAQDLISLQSDLAQEIFLMSLMGGTSVSGGVLTFSFSLFTTTTFPVWPVDKFTVHNMSHA